MGGIIGGGSNAKQQKAVGSLQFQTSQQGGVIPLVYGTTRVTPNLIEYDDFKATPASAQSGVGKGGGGGKGGGQQYKYSASVIMGLCQGPITGIGTVWWDKNIGTLSSLPAAVYFGSDGQAPDPYWQTNHPVKALGYSGTATAVANNYAMGNTATLPNFSFEVMVCFRAAAPMASTPILLQSSPTFSPTLAMGLVSRPGTSAIWDSIPHIAKPPESCCRRCSRHSRKRNSISPISSKLPTALLSGRAGC